MSDVRTLRRMALPDPFDEREVWCAKELTWAADRIESLEAALDAASKRLIEGGDFLAKEALVATIKALEADHEKAVALVIEASIATGHADTSADLMAEVLHKVGELRHALETTQQAKKNNELLMGGLGAANTGLRAENAALREAIKCVWVSWHEWRDDPSENTLYFLEREINAAGELIPPTTDKGE